MENAVVRAQSVYGAYRLGSRDAQPALRRWREGEMRVDEQVSRSVCCSEPLVGSVSLMRGRMGVTTTDRLRYRCPR